MTLCKHCGLEIAQIVDPWGHTSHKGVEHGWYHVKATDDAEGHYVENCPDEDYDGEVAEPGNICDKCEERLGTIEGSEVVYEEMGFKQYGTIWLCEKCNHIGERDPDADRDAMLDQQWEREREERKP